MSIKLANRVTQIQPSATFAINAKANALKAAGHNIINMSVGEPDFETPDGVKEAGIKAIQEGFTRYTAADGIMELKVAIIAKLSTDNQLEYAPNEILVSNGVKQSLYNLCQVILESGDEAIVLAPYWVSYPAMVLLADATPVTISSDITQEYKITAEQLEAAITDKTRLLFLNSPCNPSGMSYTEQELKALANVLVKYPNIVIASDDIYEYILLNEKPFCNILNVCPELRDRTIVLNGVSKSHAMTGWRIGFAAGNQEIIGAMKKVQSQSTSSPNAIAQKAAVAALKQDRATLNPMIEAYKERHAFLYKALSECSLAEVLPSDSTFYLFVNITRAIEKYGMADDVEFASFLLDEAKVATVPGTAFGCPGYIRLSFANSMPILQEALKRLEPILNDS